MVEVVEPERRHVADAAGIRLAAAPRVPPAEERRGDDDDHAPGERHFATATSARRLRPKVGS